MAGRITKLTPERQARIAQLLRAGNGRGVSALAAGITHQTFDDWLRQGRQAKSGHHLQFLQAVEIAEAEAEAAAVARIKLAAQGATVVKRLERTIHRQDGSIVTEVEETVAPGQWTADAWWLEPKNPAVWGRRDTVTIEIAEAMRQQQETFRRVLYEIDSVLPPEYKRLVAQRLRELAPPE